MAVSNHLSEMVTMEDQNHGGLKGDIITRRTYHPGVREHARDVSGPPLHYFVPSGATVDENGDVSGQHDPETLHGLAFRGQNVTSIEMPNGPMRRPATRVPRAAPIRGSCARSTDRQDSVVVMSSPHLPIRRNRPGFRFVVASRAELPHQLRIVLLIFPSIRISCV